MKNLKKYIHIYITTVSMIAFLMGWGFLAHAPNLVATTTTTSAQTVTSASPLQSNASLLTITQSTSTSQSTSGQSTVTPALRTGGS